MSLGCQSSYYNRMYKIIEESLDAALYVCNHNLERFTVAKLFDVFDQTFPTAFILSTGYWIFFVSNCGAPLCVCGRFGIVCRHVRSRTHWIDLQAIADKTESIVFTPKIYGAVIPRKYSISIDTSTECNGYVISINMDLVYTRKIRREFHVNIRACYGYIYPCYGALFSIRFTPNPILKGNYGNYLDELRIHRAVLINRKYVDDLIVSPYSMPSSGLLLVSVNLMKYDIPTKISAVPLSEWDISKNDFRSRDASTQTTNKHELDLYKKALENFSSSIWRYNEPTEADSQILSRLMTHNMDLKFRKTFPLGIDNSEQYDKQFPDMKIKATTNAKTSKNPICENSIPKPILASSAQGNGTQSKYPTEPKTEDEQLPNFQDAFYNCQYFAKPQSIKRRRGRPKVPRSYNMVVANKKLGGTSSMDGTDYRSPVSSDLAATLCLKPIPSGSEEEKPSTGVDIEGLAEFDEIVKQVNEKCRFFADEDYDKELDLINQLITDKMQNELIGNCDEKPVV